MLIPDEVNNAIVVRANAIDYGKVRKTIETLDIVPRAVLIEVMVAEVDLTKDFTYGMQYYYQTHPSTNTGYSLSFGGLSNAPRPQLTSATGATTPTGATGAFPLNIGTVAGAGLGLAWVANAQNIAALLSFISTKSNVTVLSTPTLLATDNMESTITVGGSVPVPTGSVCHHRDGDLGELRFQHDPIRGNRSHPERNAAYKRRGPGPARTGTDDSTGGATPLLRSAPTIPRQPLPKGT